MQNSSCNPVKEKLLEFFEPSGLDYAVDSILNGLVVDILFADHRVAILVEPLPDNCVDWRVSQRNKRVTAVKIKKAELAGYKIFYFRQKQLKGKNFKLSMQQVDAALKTLSSPKQTLPDDPNWEALACKKLGIDPAKPKRIPING